MGDASDIEMDNHLMNGDCESYEWDDLDCSEKGEIVEKADKLGIPPNFVQEMYENGELSF
jgi:hypothetical protein